MTTILPSLVPQATRMFLDNLAAGNLNGFLSVRMPDNPVQESKMLARRLNGFG